MFHRAKRCSPTAPSRASLAFLALAFTAAGFLAVGCAPEGAPDGAQGGETAAEAGADVGGEMGTADDSAAVLADRAMEAMGGRSAWDSARFIAFDWIVDRGETQVRRSHAWDRWEGTYRLAWEQDGEPRVAIFDVNDVRRDSVVGKVPAGDVWAGGERLEGVAADSALHRAYATFINDSYWLLMPYKWADEGVRAEYLGEMEEWGETYEVVELTFEDVGLPEQVPGVRGPLVGSHGAVATLPAGRRPGALLHHALGRLAAIRPDHAVLHASGSGGQLADPLREPGRLHRGARGGFRASRRRGRGSRRARGRREPGEFRKLRGGRSRSLRRHAMTDDTDLPRDQRPRIRLTQLSHGAG